MGHAVPGGWVSDRRLGEWVIEARARTLALIADLTDEQLVGPRLAIVNPLGWEAGHVAWFQEKWVLRHALHRAQLVDGADGLWDSNAIPHDVRWDLPLPSRPALVGFLEEVRDRVLEHIARGVSDEERYFILLSVFHEDMHDEAFLYTRQTLAYPAPGRDALPSETSASGGPLRGDARVPGGTFQLGAEPGTPFVFDNEKWAHPARVEPFAIARAPVTQAELAAFVDDGGYASESLWSEEGRRWRTSAGAIAPLHWRRDGGAWQRRDFDRWVPLEPDRPAIHVGWYEAEAFCAWAGRRLPTELEWEVAASSTLDEGRLGRRKHSFPWGNNPPTIAVANLDGRALGCVDVGALPAGDSALGCRQLLGNVWEWTASDFLPYPGFVADPYREYSEPWFGDHKVLRGGCWATTARLLRNTWRNFYKPDRRDVWAGFRTCARGAGGDR